jgi:hypothetical protein
MLRKPTLADFGLTTTQYSDYLKAKEAEEKIILDLAKRELAKVSKSELKSNFGCLALLVIVFAPIIYLIIYMIESGQGSDLLKTFPFFIIYLVFVLWKSLPIISRIFKYFIKKEATREEIDNASSQIRRSRLKKFEGLYKDIIAYEEKVKSYENGKLEAKFPEISNFNFNLST